MPLHDLPATVEEIKALVDKLKAAFHNEGATHAEQTARAYQRLRDDGVLIPQITGWISGEVVQRESFEDREFFTEGEERILEVLRREYGRDLIVLTCKYPNGQKIKSILILRPEFYNPKRVKADVAKEVFILQTASTWTRFSVHEFGAHRTLLASLRKYKIDRLIRPALGEVVVEGGVRKIPTWSGGTSEVFDYTDFPTFGRSLPVNPQDLLENGVVVNLLGKNYRVWFDHTLYVKANGEFRKSARGEYALRVQRTEDPVSLRPAEHHTSNRMLGRGSTQQGSATIPLDGKPPYCLMVLHIEEADNTVCVMVQVDDHGEIELAWISQSST